MVFFSQDVSIIIKLFFFVKIVLKNGKFAPVRKHPYRDVQITSLREL